MPATPEQNERFPFLAGIDDDEKAASIAFQYLDQLVQHPGWTILMAQLDRDEKEALAQLARVDPNDTKRIIQLQLDARIKQFLIDTIECMAVSMQQETGELFPPEE